MDIVMEMEMVLKSYNEKLTFDEIDGPNHRLSIMSSCITRCKGLFKGDFFSHHVLNCGCKLVDSFFPKVLVVASDAGSFVSGA